MKKIESGVMVMKGDKAWGIAYEDGHCTEYGWLNPAKAPIHDPKFCLAPTDVTYAGSPYIKELEKGRIIYVKRTTTVKIIGDKNEN